MALGAAISSFGTLNGWVLIAGQLPMAVAADGPFPRALGRSGHATVFYGFMLLLGGLPVYIWVRRTRESAAPPHRVSTRRS